MPFVPDTNKPKKSGSQFLRIVSGVPVVIQVMDTDSTKHIQHWIKDGSGRRVGITCPGSDVCPICARNRAINYDNKNPNYVAAQKRYRINVLDLTPVKRCPACGTAYALQATPHRCTEEGCNTDLSGVEAAPAREVKILERGVRLMQQLDALAGTPNPFTNKVEDIRTYPITFIATGSGREMNITPVPQAPNDLDVDTFERLDLAVRLVLKPEEIKYLIDGGSYNDVIEARRAEYAAANVPSDTDSEIPF